LYNNYNKIKYQIPVTETTSFSTPQHSAQPQDNPSPLTTGFLVTKVGGKKEGSNLHILQTSSFLNTFEQIIKIVETPQVSHALSKLFT